MTLNPAHQLAPAYAWKKSSYSDGTGNNCIEVADLTAQHGTVYVRDSKNIAGPALHLSPEQFAGLLSFALTDTTTP